MISLLSLVLSVINPQLRVALDPQLLCNNISINFPASDSVVEVGFYHPAFNGRTRDVPLEGTLPPPFSDWRLVEVNPARKGTSHDGYVILRNEKTGDLVALGVDPWDGTRRVQARTPPPQLRPSTRPAPLSFEIACIALQPRPSGRIWDGHFKALLVAGEYVAEDVLGWFTDGDLLPKPWDAWRVTRVFFGERFHGPGPVESGVMVRNEKTGQMVQVSLKRIGTPSRATTHPSDDLIAAAATQPAK